jgi:hypothetical protein
MEECKMPVWERDKKLPAPNETFSLSKNTIFQRIASF